jgi:queuosine precursor transporter
MVKITGNRFFIILAFLMALIIVLSNYLVQFPINHFGLKDLLTYGAFSYPIAFLITDLANRTYGKEAAKKIVYLGFILGVALTLLFSTDFSNLISKRIAVGSGTAFISAQLFDIYIFNKLRKKVWYIAPLASSLIGSIIDTFLFFSIAFYGTGINWISLSFGDLMVKFFVALVMLIPFRLLILRIKETKSISNKVSV